MLTIRSATREDIPLINDLAREIWPGTYTLIIGEAQVAYMLARFYAPGPLQKQMEEPGNNFIICCDGNEPVGFASWSLTGTACYKLHKLYVLPGMQGKGIGRCMVAHIMEDVRIKMGDALRLNVNRYNTPAIAFYEKTGFRKIYDEDIDIGDGYFMNDHVMEIGL